MSRPKAIELIKKLGGKQKLWDRRHPWRIDAKKYYTWDSKQKLKGIDEKRHNRKIDKILARLRKAADSLEGVSSINLSKKPDRSNYSLRVSGRYGKEKLISLGTSDYEDAIILRKDIYRILDEEYKSNIIYISSEDFVNEFVNFKRKNNNGKTGKKGCSEDTVKYYKHVLSEAFRLLDNPESLRNIDSEDIECVIDKYYSLLELDNSTITNRIGILKQAFKYAKRNHYIKNNPSEDIDKPGRSKARREIYSEDEVKTIFHEIDIRINGAKKQEEAHDWNMFKEIIHGLNEKGTRITDEINFVWGNVGSDFETLTFIQVKTNKEVEINLSTEHGRQLSMLHDQTCSENKYMYHDIEGNPYSYKSVYRKMKSILKTCGIEKIAPLHCFRRTVVMRMKNAGLKPHQVAAYIGDTVETVNRYYTIPEAPSRKELDGVAVGHSKEAKTTVL